MKILFIASEGIPFVKSGGLADVIGSLPKVLHHEGAQVRVILPLHSLIPEYEKQRMSFMLKSSIKIGWREQYCGVYELHDDGITYYFIDNKFYFEKERIYGYEDNFHEAERYSFFSTAALEILPLIQYQPDIIHTHDWHTGIISFLLKTKYTNHPFYQPMKTVFTIHNIQYQGVYFKEVLFDLLSGKQQDYSIDGVEYYGAINFMKAGIRYADIVTTVSPSYAAEIQTEYYGEGLDGLLKERNQDLFGIINGIDYQFFDPSKDKYVAFPYHASSIVEKKKNKESLQQIFHCKLDDTIPLIAMVTRLVDQKGIELVMHILDELLLEHIQVVILGSGRPEYECFLQEKHDQYPDKLKIYLGFNEGLAHQIYAGSDMFLMPSKFEPCGLGQLIALRYGSLPIVRETGGLRDTIIPYNKYTGAGNGFSFQNYNAHELLFTLKEALQVYQQKEVWHKLVIQAMSMDYSWRESAKSYLNRYQLLLSTDLTPLT